VKDLFEIREKVIVVTGAAGVLTGGVAKYLQKQGATVGISRSPRTRLIWASRLKVLRGNGYTWTK